MAAPASPGKHPTASTASTSAAEGEDELRAPDTPSVLRELKAAACLEPDAMETL
jgi:hypothetical protein